MEARGWGICEEEEKCQINSNWSGPLRRATPGFQLLFFIWTLVMVILFFVTWLFRRHLISARYCTSFYLTKIFCYEWNIALEWGYTYTLTYPEKEHYEKAGRWWKYLLPVVSQLDRVVASWVRSIKQLNPIFLKFLMEFGRGCFVANTVFYLYKWIVWSTLWFRFWMLY